MQKFLHFFQQQLKALLILCLLGDFTNNLLMTLLSFEIHMKICTVCQKFSKLIAQADFDECFFINPTFICFEETSSYWSVQFFFVFIGHHQSANLVLPRYPSSRGWSGGAMVLGKLPVPGLPTIWITVGQGPTALAVGAGGGCLDIFILTYPFSPLSPSLWETARYRLKYCLKGPLNPKQPTNPSSRLWNLIWSPSICKPSMTLVFFLKTTES